MRFSIVMPTLGKRMDFLQKAIQSVLDQDFQDFELIVKDGGKEDIGHLLPKDARLRYVHLKDNGIGQGMNQGCELAQGEILNESNDDDLMAPGTLKFIDENIGDAIWCYGQIKYGDEVTDQSWNYDRLKSANIVPQPSVFFRKIAWEQVGGFDEVNGLAADYDMWLKLGARWTPKYFRRIMAFYTLHPDQLTNTAFDEQSRQALNVRLRYL